MKHCRSLHIQASFRGALLVILLIVLLLFSIQPVFAAGCGEGKHCAYLPHVKSPAAGDLVIQGIEATQAVQDPSNSVPLVAGRNTLLRIYARTVGTSTPISNVKISVEAAGAYTLNEAPRSYSATVPLSYDRASIQGSINITLPAQWTSGSVTLIVRLDPDNQIAENSESNNAITKTFNFQTVAPLKIKIVPIKCVNEKDGHTYPAPTKDSISDWIARTYPVPGVEVSWHAAHTFKGNLSTADGFSRLLNEITSLKNIEGQPPEVVYYGLVPTSGNGRTWFYGGVAGIGWIGLRAAVGLDLNSTSGQIAAHEIGHNMGLEHSPCGSPAGANQNYPYSDGSIGQLGTDTVAGVLYSPSTKDVMSYCTPKWISDYTYRTIFNKQRQAGAMYAPAAEATGEAQRGLLVRVNFTDTGAVMEPAYVVPGAVTAQPEPGDYLLETFDAQGAMISQTPLRAFEAATEGEIQQSAIHALVPLSDTPVAFFHLVKDGQIIASQELLTPTGPAEAPALMAAPDALATAIGESGRPALVRYSTDGGATWTALGLDLTGDTLPAAPEENVIYQVLSSGTWN